MPKTPLAVENGVGKPAAVAVLSIGLSVAVQAGPLTSGCERCHLVLHDGPSGPHVVEWTTSEHAARRVGCVQCHNGNAASDEALEAHKSDRSHVVL